MAQAACRRWSLAGAITLVALQPGAWLPTGQINAMVLPRDSVSTVSSALSGPPGTDWAAAGLSATATEVPSLGLTLHLPVDCTYTLHPQEATRVVIQTEDHAWAGAIKLHRTSNADVTIESVGDQIVKNLRSNPKTFVRSRKTLTINGETAEQLAITYARSVLPGQSSLITTVHTVFNPSPGTFVIHYFWIEGEEIDRLLELNERSVKTMRFRDPDEMASKREAGIDAFNDLHARLDEQWYRSILVPQRWYRVYKPGDGTTAEVAYYQIEESIAPMGAAGRTRRPAQYSSLEREEGLLVRQIARYLMPIDILPDARVFEIERISWMSFDRRREVFSIRSSQFARQISGRYQHVSDSSITGTRTNLTMEIVAEEAEGRIDARQIRIPERAYLSQAEQHLLYRILGRGSVPGVFGMFTFEPSLKKIAYRVESIATGPGAKQLTSKSTRTPDAPPHIVTLGAQREILKIVQSNGEITIPISPQELRRIWQSKRLPTGPLRSSGRPGR